MVFQQLSFREAHRSFGNGGYRTIDSPLVNSKAEEKGVRSKPRSEAQVALDPYFRDLVFRAKAAGWSAAVGNRTPDEVGA